MEVLLEPGSEIEQISVTEFNKAQINSIGKKGGELRSKSKAPTFCSHLPRYRPHSDEQLRFYCPHGSANLRQIPRDVSCQHRVGRQEASASHN